MKDLTATSFGYVIAFLLPGLFGMYGLGLLSPQIAALLRPALTTDTTVGPSVIMLLTALTVGLILSAIRYLIFEKLVCHNKSLDGDLFARLIKADQLALFKEIADAHYRYHQFYGGCFIAAAITYSGWYGTSHSRLSCGWQLFSLVMFIAIEALLWASAVSSFNAYVNRGNMAGVKDQGT